MSSTESFDSWPIDLSDFNHSIAVTAIHCLGPLSVARNYELLRETQKLNLNLNQFDANQYIRIIVSWLITK